MSGLLKFGFIFAPLVAISMVISGEANGAVKQRVASTSKKVLQFTDVTTTYDPAPFERYLKNSKAFRKIASGLQPTPADFEGADPSVRFSDLLNDYLAKELVNEKGVKIKGDSAESLAYILKKHLPNYDKMSISGQFVLLNLELLAPLRGVVTRLRDLFEEKGMGVQSATVTMIRSIATNLKIRFPEDKWTAGFEHFVKPAENPADATSFNSADQFQEFLEKYRANIAHAINRLSAIRTQMSKDPNLKIYVDNKIAYGGGTFDVDNSYNRYKIIRFGEVSMILSALEMSLFQINYFCAYTQTHMVEVAQKLGNLSGWDGFKIISGVDGVTAEDRVKKVLLDADFKDYLTLKHNKMKDSETGKEVADAGIYFMGKAFEHLRNAVKNGKDGFDSIVDREPHDYEMIKTLEVQANRKEMGLRFATMNDLITKDTAEVISPMNGNKVSIKFKEIFTNPPEDLKGLLPNDFEAGKTELKPRVNGRTVKYRNYFYGRPIGWRIKPEDKGAGGIEFLRTELRKKETGQTYVQAWGDYLTNEKNPANVAEAVNVLQTTWGAGAVGSALSPFVR